MSHDIPETALPDRAPNPRSITRRTVVAGAAWTVPVIALSTATPAMAASNDLSLAFDRSSYSGQACGTITGAKVTATRGGQPAPGQSITVTLADGYTFDGGSTSFTGTSGSDGALSLPAINVPARGGDSTMTATSGSASTTATLTAPPAGAAFQYATGSGNSSTTTRQTGVPPRSTAVGDQTFLASNGDLYRRGNVIAQNVKSASFDFYPEDNTVRVNYVNDTGAFQYVSRTFDDGGTTTRQAGVPTGSTAIGDQTFLASNGDLYRRGTVIARNVKSATFDFYTGDNTVRINYVNDTGAFQYVSRTTDDGGTTTRQTGVPTDSTAIGDRTFLASNGDLYRGGNVIARNVKSAAFEFYPGDDTVRVNYVNDTGAYQYQSRAGGSAGTTTLQTGVPTDSTAIGDQTFLASNGDLYRRGNVIARGVSSATFEFYPEDNTVRVNYVSATC